MESRESGFLFVYNADRGLFKAISDMARKIFSPDTYACNLCAFTYTNLGMRKEWKDLISRRLAEYPPL